MHKYRVVSAKAVVACFLALGHCMIKSLMNIILSKGHVYDQMR